MLVFGQNWLYSGKSGCIRTKWFYSVKVIIVLQSGCIWAKWLYSGKSGFIRAKWLYCDKDT